MNTLAYHYSIICSGFNPLQVIAKYENCARRSKTENLFNIYKACWPGVNDDMMHKGLYDHQLKSWYQNFQPQSFCVLSYEFLHQEPAAALEVVGKFLGLEPVDWASNVEQLKPSREAAKIVSAQAEEEEDADESSAEANISEVPVTEAVLKHAKAFLKVHGDKKYQLVKVMKYHGCAPS